MVSKMALVAHRLGTLFSPILVILAILLFVLLVSLASAPGVVVAGDIPGGGIAVRLPTPTP